MLDHSYFHSIGKFLAIQALRIFDIFSAFFCSSVFSVFEVLDDVDLGVLRNLIDSSAHHSEREIIVTQGKFHLAAKLIFQIINQNIIREKKLILLVIFIVVSII